MNNGPPTKEENMELWEVFALFMGWRAQAFQDMLWLLEQMQGLDPSRIPWLLEKLQGLDFSQTTRSTTRWTRLPSTYRRRTGAR